MIRIALAQTNPLIGDVAGNLARAQELARKAARRGAELVAFPELTLIGYPPKDLLFDPRLLAAQNEALQALLRFSRKVSPTLVIGVALSNPAPGKPLFNGLLAIRGGEIEREYRKQLLPTYDVFDERRYFEPGSRDPAVMQVAGHRVGLLICEDGWNYAGRSGSTNLNRGISGNSGQDAGSLVTWRRGVFDEAEIGTADTAHA